MQRHGKARDTRLVATRVHAGYVADIGSAHSAGFDRNQNLVGPGRRDIALDQFQLPRCRDQHGTIGFPHAALLLVSD
jgi:hypothetical protein